ncbi:hypothetical protein PR048_030918 [Dryococelus australis]|uniref:Reverse transcriptase domain-containing protein n=1 Tax=Dryococelus australis TaxID=614101 RepID=A0ABQ9GAP8_9NEOP|nr:hypothetical protein PR048_030918 [Dryococelus australis]
MREWGIEKLIRGLESSKAGGPDGIGNAALKFGGKELAKYLEVLFKKSLGEGKLPQDWKDAMVIPIHKQGEDRGRPGSYRPVSLTSSTGKVMERLVVQYVVRVMNNRNWLESQHEDLMQVVDEGKQMDACFIDFEKALDKVPHGTLMRKVEALIPDRRVVEWIGDFLRGRRQRVKVGEAISEEGVVTSGVPQGSVLGPLLFTIMVNDMGLGIRGKIRLFADDCVVYAEVGEGGRNLQADIDKIWLWTRKNKMKINVRKTKVVRFTRKKMISRDMWKKQVERVVAKGRRALDMLERALNGVSCEVKKVYGTMVRAVLEYAAAIWDPYVEVRELEKVQRKAARWVKGRWRRQGQDDEEEGNYRPSIMMKETGWSSLKDRRKVERLVRMYRMLNEEGGWGGLHCKLSKGCLEDEETTLVHSCEVCEGVECVEGGIGICEWGWYIQVGSGKGVDPTPTDLIVKFLSIVLDRKDEAKPGEGMDATDTVKAEETTTKRNRKCLALKILSLKVAAHLKWNLSILESKREQHAAYPTGSDSFSPGGYVTRQASPPPTLRSQPTSCPDLGQGRAPPTRHEAESLTRVFPCQSGQEDVMPHPHPVPAAYKLPRPWARQSASDEARSRIADQSIPMPIRAGGQYSHANQGRRTSCLTRTPCQQPTSFPDLGQGQAPPTRHEAESLTRVFPCQSGQEDVMPHPHPVPAAYKLPLYKSGHEQSFLFHLLRFPTALLSVLGQPEIFEALSTPLVATSPSTTSQPDNQRTHLPTPTGALHIFTHPLDGHLLLPKLPQHCVQCWNIQWLEICHPFLCRRTSSGGIGDPNSSTSLIRQHRVRDQWKLYKTCQRYGHRCRKRHTAHLATRQLSVLPQPTPERQVEQDHATQLRHEFGWDNIHFWTNESHLWNRSHGVGQTRYDWIKYTTNTAPKKLPLPMQVTLMQALLFVVLEREVDVNLHLELDFSVLSEHVLFAVTLYHTWVLRAIMYNRLAARQPRPSFITIPGLQDPTFVPSNVMDEILVSLDSQIGTSLEVLSRIVTTGRPAKVPSFSSFVVLHENSQDARHEWNLCRSMPLAEFHCQVFFDLGRFHFYRAEYGVASEEFRKVVKLHRELEASQLYYCTVSQSDLEGYSKACDIVPSTPAENLLYQMHRCIRDQYTGIIQVLQQDNLKHEIPQVHRDILELDIQGAMSSGKFTVARDLPLQVTTLNMVNRVVTGAVHWSSLGSRPPHSTPKALDMLVNNGKTSRRPATMESRNLIGGKGVAGYGTSGYFWSLQVQEEVRAIFKLLEVEVFSNCWRAFHRRGRFIRVVASAVHFLSPCAEAMTNLPPRPEAGGCSATMWCWFKLPSQLISGLFALQLQAPPAAGSMVVLHDTVTVMGACHTDNDNVATAARKCEHGSCCHNSPTVKQDVPLFISIHAEDEAISHELRHGSLFPNTVRCIVARPSNCTKTCILLNLLEEENSLQFENTVEGMGHFPCSDNEAVVPTSEALPNLIFVFYYIACEERTCTQEYFSMGRLVNVDYLHLGQTYLRIRKQLLRYNTSTVVLFRMDDMNLLNGSMLAEQNTYFQNYLSELEVMMEHVKTEIVRDVVAMDEHVMCVQRDSTGAAVAVKTEIDDSAEPLKKRKHDDVQSYQDNGSVGDLPTRKNTEKRRRSEEFGRRQEHRLRILERPKQADRGAVATACFTKEAMANVLRKGCIPRNPQIDQSKEFYNAKFQAVMKKYNINHYSTYSNLKASIVERFNRILKGKMWRHFAANRSYKSLTLPKLVPKIGELVLVSKQKGIFEKAFAANWSPKLFCVQRICNHASSTCFLEDLNVVPIHCGFYVEEIQPVKFPDVYLVEKVLKQCKVALKPVLLAANQTEKQRIKLFLIDLVEFGVYPGLAERVLSVPDLKSVFVAEELETFSKKTAVVQDGDIPQLLLASDWDIPDDLLHVFELIKKHSSGNQLLESGSLEQKLILSYDTAEIEMLLKKICAANPMKVQWRINNKWELPIPLQSVVISLPRGFLQDFVYVLLAKSRELSALKVRWEACNSGLQPIDLTCGMLQSDPCVTKSRTPVGKWAIVSKQETWHLEHRGLTQALSGSSEVQKTTALVRPRQAWRASPKLSIGIVTYLCLGRCSCGGGEGIPKTAVLTLVIVESKLQGSWKHTSFVMLTGSEAVLCRAELLTEQRETDDFDTALAMLGAVDTHVKGAGTVATSVLYKLSKLLGWECLLIKVTQLLVEWPCPKITVRLHAFLLSKPGSIPGGLASRFFNVVIVPDNAAGRHVFAGTSRFCHPFIPALLHTHLTSPSLTLKTLMLTAAQFSSLLTPIPSLMSGSHHITLQ